MEISGGRHVSVQILTAALFKLGPPVVQLHEYELGQRLMGQASLLQTKNTPLKSTPSLGYNMKFSSTPYS